MNSTTKGVYLDPDGPLETALLLPESNLLLVQIVCSTYELKKYARTRLAFKEQLGVKGTMFGACSACGGKTSLVLDLKSGLARCSICKGETDIVSLTREKRCRHAVYALDYLLTYLCGRDYAGKQRLVERLESLTLALADTLLTAESLAAGKAVSL